MIILDRIMALFARKPLPMPRDMDMRVQADIERRDQILRRLQAKVNAKTRRVDATNQ